MPRNIKLIVEYDGSRFHGWQQQGPDTRTVEAVLGQAIHELTGERPSLVAAGRTDAGVHALGQCVNFPMASGFPLEQLAGALNSRLRPDVVIRQAAVVDDSFHARYSARLRWYAYRIRQSVDRAAYERQYAWAVPDPLDLPVMAAAGRRLEGTHDFGAFGRSPRPGGHTVRRVHRVDVRGTGEWVTIGVGADAFLYGMVRRIAGAMVAIGRRRRPPAWIDELLAGSTAGLQPAPAHGLVQVAVEY